MDQVWRFNVDYTKVSDPYYFNDFDSKYGSSTDGYATQKFSVGYAIENFNATVSTKQFQVFDTQTRSTYGAEPQLDVNWYQNDVGPFDTHVYARPCTSLTRTRICRNPRVFTSNQPSICRCQMTGRA